MARTDSRHGRIGEPVRCRCLDVPNCGREFLADSSLQFCPFCRERAAPVDASAHERHPEAEFSHWRAAAVENVDEWGVQTPETVLLAMMEELGELVQTRLEYTSGDGEYARIQQELDDLAPLCWQLEWALQQEVTIDS